MADKPDTEKGWLTRALLKFLAAPTGLVLVCVILHLTGAVKWGDIVDLLRGRQEAVAADKGKEPQPNPQIGPAGPNAPTPADQDKNKGRKELPTVVPVVPVVPPPNAAPMLKATPEELAFGPGESTKQVQIAVADEAPVGVTVTAAPTAPGLIPADGVKVSGAGVTRFLSVTIDPEKWGTATIRVTATDAEKLRTETTIRVKVPEPALSIAVIPDVSITLGDPLPMVAVTVEDAARKPGKVTLTTSVNDPLLSEEGVTLDPTGKKLQLKPKAKATGTATVTLIAQTDDGREARRSFKVTVSPKPLGVGDAARVTPHGGADEIDSNSQPGGGENLGVPGLKKNSAVTVLAVKGDRCKVGWGKQQDEKQLRFEYEGWLDKRDLTPAGSP